VDEKLKRRLVGATVLAALAIIFIPMLLEERAPVEPPVLVPPVEIPEPQAFDPRLLGEPVPEPEPLPASAGGGEPSADGNRRGLSAWVVQAGSFSDREKAAQLAVRLRRLGLDATVEQARIRGRAVYRVQMGPFTQRRRTDRVLARVKKKIAPDAIVRRYP